MAAKKKQDKPYTGPAVALEDGVRVETAKHLDPVQTAQAGALVKPKGLTKPQKVTDGLLENPSIVQPQKVNG